MENNATKELICDSCGAILPFDEVLDEQGWAFYTGKDDIVGHICEDCLSYENRIIPAITINVREDESPEMIASKTLGAIIKNEEASCEKKNY